MKSDQKGFGVVEILLIVVVMGLIGIVGWIVYDRKDSDNESPANSVNTQSSQQDQDNTSETVTESDVKTVDGIKFTVLSNWVNASGPFKDSEINVSGQYILSPDYEEAGLGQLYINKGAYINFQKLEWEGIDKNTSVEDAANVIKNSEGSYLDTSSVNVTSLGEVQVVMFNAGHTTDGVTVLHKTSSGQWLDASFSTTTGGDGEYNAQDSTHYKTFQAWLDTFIELNP